MPSEFWFFSLSAILGKTYVSKTLTGGKICFCDYRLICLSVNLSPFTSG